MTEKVKLPPPEAVACFISPERYPGFDVLT
jgi:hypothetical protein